MSTTYFTSTEDLSSSYDFVVAGGGQAGVVVASRLTEDPRISVLLLEAGQSNLGNPLVLTPPLAKKLHQNDKHDWYYQTENQVSSTRVLYLISLKNIRQDSEIGRLFITVERD